MATRMTDDMALRMAAIETHRVELERSIGVHAARAEAVRQLKEALGLEQAALQHQPYGHGHAWNAWAIQVAIEKLAREARVNDARAYED